MNSKRQKDQVILADMHTDGTRFTEQLLAKKEEKERLNKKLKDIMS